MFIGTPCIREHGTRGNDGVMRNSLEPGRYIFKPIKELGVYIFKPIKELGKYIQTN